MCAIVQDWREELQIDTAGTLQEMNSISAMKKLGIHSLLKKLANRQVKRVKAYQPKSQRVLLALAQYDTEASPKDRE